MYTITLNDGTKLENLVLNGNNFISQTKIEDSTFENNLGTVTITGAPDNPEYEGQELTETTEVLHNCKIDANRMYGEECWFIIREKTNSELKEEQLNSVLNALLIGEEN